MENLFIEYPKCTTCKKAKKWLEDNDISFVKRDIITDNPNEDEIKAWLLKSGLPLKSFFNTNGVLYKEMKLKDKLLNMSEEEQIKLLASDGKLVKRPIFVSTKGIFVGFKPENWQNIKS